MHLQAGVANGSLVELHYLAVELCKQSYSGLPNAQDGVLVLPESPGLGFELNRDAVRELAKRPLSQGRGKG
jgi:L-alanine-DL-glutamate epimerase-like enolase superfamily enzyme